MKKETISYSKEKITLSIDDVRELLPNDEFEYKFYWNYDDEISKDLFLQCEPNRREYNEFRDFVIEWRDNLEHKLWLLNCDGIFQDITTEINEKVEKALKDKGIEFDEIELDFYVDDLYSIDLDLDFILKRSRIDWNIIWRDNFDGFNEGEVYEDNRALKQLVDLYPNLVDKNDLEAACCDGMYNGSQLKISFRHSMKDFLDILARGSIDLSGASAVLHLGVNGSGSSDFTLGKGEVEFSKPDQSGFNYRDRELDGAYGIGDTYGGVLNNRY